MGNVSVSLDTHYEGIVVCFESLLSFKRYSLYHSANLGKLPKRKNFLKKKPGFNLHPATMPAIISSNRLVCGQEGVKGQEPKSESGLGLQCRKISIPPDWWVN